MSMTHEKIIEKLRKAMKQSSAADMDWDAVTSRNTIESLGFDSLSMLDLVYDIQQEFAIEFEPEELFDIKTVDELAVFLERKMV